MNVASEQLHSPDSHIYFLKKAILFTIFAHGAGMIFMLIFLLPGIPGGTESNHLLRISYYVDHPWRWRLGWIPWQITAFSDLILSIALLRMPDVPRLPAIMGILFTIAAIIPDQTGQFIWAWIYPHQAQQAILNGFLDQYLVRESRVFIHIAGTGPVGYLLAALCWTWSFVKLDTWWKWLNWISSFTWTLFAMLIVPVFFPERYLNSKPISLFVSAGNGLAFLFLMIWFVGVYSAVNRKIRISNIDCISI